MMKQIGSRGRALAAFAMAAAVTGCGGGGGGGTPETSTPVQTPDPTAPTFRMSALQDGQLPQLVEEIADASAGVLDMAQFATDIAHRFSSVEATGSGAVTANCAYQGSITLRLEDKDGDHRASAGDSIVAVLDRCGVPTLKRSATGTLRLDIGTVPTSTELGFQGTLTIADVLKIAPLGGGDNIGTVLPGTLRGSLGVQWSDTSSTSSLKAVSSAADDLRFTAIYNVIETTTGYQRMEIARTLRYDTAAVSTSISLSYDTGARGGALRVRTPQPYEGYLNAGPKQLMLTAEMADGSRLQLARTPQRGFGVELGYAWKSSAGADLVPTKMTSWPQRFSTLARDPRQSRDFSGWSEDGPASTAIWPWKDNGLAWDSIFDQSRTPTGAEPYRADAVFQRPVVASRTMTEGEGATIRLQFGRPIAADLNYRFRLADVTSDGQYAWPVATTSTRTGALFVIRLAEPLRRGRSYTLQASLDGVDWTVAKEVRDAEGGILLRGADAFSQYSTFNGFRVEVYTADSVCPSATTPSRLVAQAQLLDDATLAQVKWEQLSGPPLVLSTPNALTTNMVLANDGPVPIEDAVLQVTVTDSRGRVDRARVSVKAGNVQAQGAAFAMEMGNKVGSRREGRVGPGSIFLGPEPGLIRPRVVSADAYGTGSEFSFGTAGNQPLALGLYTPLVRDTTAISANRLSSLLYCENGNALSTGWFNVRDLGYAADGTIIRLAVDFEQHCGGADISYQKGSYRYNSAVPWNL